MDVKFPIGSSVVVECNFPRSSYKGKVVESLPAALHGMFYKVEPDVPNEVSLWIAERRLKLAPIYDDGLESWDMT